MKTLIIINPNAGGNNGVPVWKQHERTLRERFDAVQFSITDSPQAVPEIVGRAVADGVRRVLSIGGDGTNHSVINAIMQHNAAVPADPVIYGTVPAGTGRDWARSIGMPLEPGAAIEWLTRAEVCAVDVGHVRFDGQEEYFLNISSAGISNDVVQRVEASAKRQPWTFLRAILGSLLYYKPEPVTIWLDGRQWYDDLIYIIAVANGSTFAQGMRVAPDAAVNDGLFDVVVVEQMSKPAILRALPTLYSGTHVTNPRVHIAQASEVRVVSRTGRPLGMDLDGEPGHGQEIVYRIHPGALPVLMQPKRR